VKVHEACNVQHSGMQQQQLGAAAAATAAAAAALVDCTAAGMAGVAQHGVLYEACNVHLNCWQQHGHCCIR
jgi:hypothetical protein